ncbi:protein-disulfide reductase DsbD [Thiomicrorhabdus sp. zzn3]|uniref:protein-disulfide reductase DsbD n=1 Tax=Thiomicrorhabdus sp. zzn3 TaxID=3039775 RepID=UPI00243649F4|nr:protein-disulfide reductase DsbD [Thiomicrorhabdus sp. zzn3]MDG6779061.1 protein-disulfide reductase DsbD [Thiomicrorhabdus sp. zzn3]
MRWTQNPLFKWIISSLILLTATGMVKANDLLDVDDAFQLQDAKVVDGKILVEWKIADDYKLYKDKISVTSEDLSLGDTQYSKAKQTDDPLFGKTEVYVHQATLKIPYQSSASRGKLTVKYQGCADKIGVCYPPQTRTLPVDLPAPAAASTDSGNGFGSLNALNDILTANNSEPELLDAEDAFRFSSSIENGQIVARWAIADDYHLYQDKIKTKVVNGEATLGELQLPAAETIDDPLFGKTAVYHGQLEAIQPVTEINKQATIEFEFQGCSASAGVCYPPMRKTIEIQADQISVIDTSPAAVVGQPAQSETDQIADTLKNSSVWIVIATFFVFGLLLAFTPCVFPMIPILSSIIVGQGEQLTTRRAFVMSLVYVLAMSVTYTVAGVLAGVFGENLQAAFQNPWILGTFSVIFILLALSMFGFYELQLPSSLQSKLTNLSNKQQGGTLTGVAVMGFLSALIVGPCVAPPLAGALIYIGQTGDALLGGTALFAMSMGMGLPLLLLGTSAGKLLPRAGGWMESVKAVFGVMLIGVAIWMAERILPAEVTLLAWALLFIISAVYMGAFESVADKSGWFKLFKGLGLALALYGAMILVGLLGGSQSLFQPLKVFQGGGSGQVEATHLEFKSIKTVEDLQTELSKGQPVMLDFYADWCVSCKEMEALTFTDKKVQASLKGVTLLQADVTANDETDKALMKQFGIIGPPAILFFNAQGEEQKAQRVVGFKDAESFNQNIQQALK